MTRRVRAFVREIAKSQDMASIGKSNEEVVQPSNLDELRPLVVRGVESGEVGQIYGNIRQLRWMDGLHVPGVARNDPRLAGRYDGLRVITLSIKLCVDAMDLLAGAPRPRPEHENVPILRQHSGEPPPAFDLCGDGVTRRFIEKGSVQAHGAAPGREDPYVQLGIERGAVQSSAAGRALLDLVRE